MAETKPQPQEDAEQRETPAVPQSPAQSAPATGRRAAFQEIKRQLTDQELASPGTQKLLLDMLFTAEADRDQCKNYVALYHEADKRAGILQEQVKSNKLNETLSAVGLTIGGTIIGLSPTFWSSGSNGAICLVVGGVLIIGAALGRIFYR